MNSKTETTKEDALALLDAIRSSGRMEYSDYCALFDAISDISIQPQFQLIPVSERLLDVNEDVLVANFAGGIVNLEVGRCEQYDDSDERFWWYSQNPIAWMPLSVIPEPFKGVTE